MQPETRKAAESLMSQLGYHEWERKDFTYAEATLAREAVLNKLEYLHQDIEYYESLLPTANEILAKFSSTADF